VHVNHVSLANTKEREKNEKPSALLPWFFFGILRTGPEQNRSNKTHREPATARQAHTANVNLNYLANKSYLADASLRWVLSEHYSCVTVYGAPTIHGCKAGILILRFSTC
jgi:hypothetical protein